MILDNAIFGNLADGRTAQLFTLETSGGLRISITNYGGIITSIRMPDRHGQPDEITAGFPSLQAYLEEHPYFGAITGRYANRIANGRFELDAKTWQLPLNSPPSHLHGGPGGFHTRLWDYSIDQKADEISLRLHYLSPHLEEGYPGNLEAMVTYTLKESGELLITYEARTDAPTHLNLTNHAYFNLGGFRDKIFDHQLMVDANHYLELNESLLPTGKLIPVQGTPYDYRPGQAPMSLIREPMDYCFVLNHGHSLDRPAAILHHPQTGRGLSLYCTQPGIQVYSANFLDGSLKGHGSIAYGQHQAVCLETQHFPDSPNHPEFPSTLLRPGETYLHQSRFVFETE
ncbi:MAG: aldose epimerase family protein [Bacteroides sp.]|jgi:aldose 1-epimerase|nr:aldose epimerase family protein [Bacteroides sp.]